MLDLVQEQGGCYRGIGGVIGVLEMVLVCPNTDLPDTIRGDRVREVLMRQ